MSLDYLIFGGSGFVGTHLSSYLEDIGSSFLIACSSYYLSNYPNYIFSILLTNYLKKNEEGI